VLFLGHQRFEASCHNAQLDSRQVGALVKRRIFPTHEAVLIFQLFCAAPFLGHFEEGSLSRSPPDKNV